MTTVDDLRLMNQTLHIFAILQNSISKLILYLRLLLFLEDLNIETRGVNLIGSYNQQASNGSVVLLTMLSFPKTKVVGNFHMLTVWLFILHLGANFDPTNCICEPPSECNECTYSDIHQDKTLFSAMCDRHNLTSVPIMLPRDHLGKLYVAFNNISRISAEVMATYPNLKELSLNANKLTMITNGSFKYNNILEKLYISANRIESLNEKIFEGLYLLTRLVLEQNEIQYLKRRTFKLLGNLAELSLKDNEISVIEEGTFEGLSELRTLMLGGNRLTDIQFTFSIHPSLTFVDFSYNNLSVIEKRTFSRVPSLRKLHVNNNNLRDVPFHALKYIRNVTELDLSANPISFIPSEAFIGLDGLETLFMNSSDIHILHPGSLTALKSLNRLYLNDNPLVCDCHMAWFRQWLEFKLGNNTSRKQRTSRFRAPRKNDSDSNFNSPSIITCHYPARIQGMQILKVKIKDFLCSCQTCMLQISCHGTVDPLCNCTNNQLVNVCSSSCKLIAPGLNNLCTGFNRTCYCSKISEACGENADLYVRNGKRSCKCKEGFTGDALIECFALEGGDEKEIPVLRVAFLIAGATVVACLAAFAVGWCRLRRRSSPGGVGLDWKNAIPFSSWANGNGTSIQLPRNSTADSPSPQVQLQGNSVTWDKWELSRDHLQIGQKIDEGEFGRVMKGLLITELGKKEVAVKTLKEEDKQFEYMFKDMMAELRILKKIGKHPNIVNLIGACTLPGGPLYIVIELVGGGNLLNYLRASRHGQKPEYVNVDPPVSEKDLLQIALDVAEGMKHICQIALVHRDLAARNILLTTEGKAKVTDFGLSRSVYTEGIYLKTCHGRLPLKWMAPESIELFVFTSQSDVWSYGVLLWEIVTFGGFPYPEIPACLLLPRLSTGYRLQKPFHCSDELYDVMLSCWHKDPDLRPTFNGLSGILQNTISEISDGYVNLTEISRFAEQEMLGEAAPSTPESEDTFM